MSMIHAITEWVVPEENVVNLVAVAERVGVVMSCVGIHNRCFFFVNWAIDRSLMFTLLPFAISAGDLLYR